MNQTNSSGIYAGPKNVKINSDYQYKRDPAPEYSFKRTVR